ncbi:hypothetical protein AB1K84_22990 [Mesobacillus foraminis]|uniref:hypothetical protein n=1 Tax=Mesobacillus foraminis TaxID=279826 RepID=UPI0039A0AD8B
MDIKDKIITSIYCSAALSGFAQILEAFVDCIRESLTKKRIQPANAGFFLLALGL